ncbi:MAG: hypothetical protein KGL13_01845 [Gammaproteobacteria bacterium]|nr:hypothetical protein [Gammaproteobacteria bacterium]
MDEGLVCWKCGATLREVPQPLSRISLCLSCRAELHVCRQCCFYDTHKAESCTEQRADPPKDKQRANFCEYFQPRANAWQAEDNSAADKAKDELQKLFQ